MDTLTALPLFEALSGLFRRHCTEPIWGRYESRETDPWEALRLFLMAYAFERSGRSPDFAPAAVATIDELGHGPLDGDVPRRAWREFAAKLESRGLNHANNPLCPRGEAFTRKTGSTVTHMKSIVELVVDDLHGQSLIAWAQEQVKQRRLVEAHRQLQQVNGIGNKIASLFFRDTVVQSGLTVCADREWLQPIDGWVKKVVWSLSGAELKTDGCKRFMVEKCRAPELANQGVWYFCARVADSSTYLVRKALASESEFKKLVLAHVDHLRDTAARVNASLADWSDARWR